MANEIAPPPMPDVKSTTADKIGGFLGAISNGGVFGSISDAIERHHQKRLAEARMYHDVMVQKMAHPAYADETHPDHQKTNDEYNAAKEAYMKAAGVNKETKKQIQQRTAIAEHHLKSGGGGGGGEGGGGGGGGAGGAQQPPSMSPPPAADAPAGGDTDSMPGASSAVPPPPKPDMTDILAGVPGERQRMAEERAQAQYKSKVDTDTAGKIAEEKAKAAAKGSEGLAKTTDAQWIKSFADEHNREPSAAEVEAHQIGKSEKPIDAEVMKGIKLAEDGDLEGAKKIFTAVQTGAGARKGPPNSGMSLMSIIDRMNKGDASAKKDFDAYMQMQKDLSKERGAGYGAGRAMYQIGAYVDGKTGQVIPLSNLDAIQRIREGADLIPSGRLPANMIASSQRLVKEATPAIKEVRDNLKAYDNSGDRAIFARVMTAAGKPAYGDESHWLGNVINQSMTEELSPEGKKLMVRLARLNETIGTLRSTLGAPATDRSMALMLGLLPGPSTPNSKMAGDMIDQLEQNVTNAVEIPALHGVAKPSSGNAKPSGKIPPPPGTSPKTAADYLKSLGVH